MDIKWEDESEIRLTLERGTAILSGNRAGLRSLAALLSALAQEEPGSHVHLDACNALEDGSAECIVELTR